MSPRPSRLAICCAGLLALPPAMAESASVSATISSVSYELIDLDLTDGIAPAIAFTDNVWSSSYYLDDQGLVESPRLDGYGSTSSTRPWGSASGGSSPGAASAQASIADPGLEYRRTGAVSNYRMQFTLTPFTRIQFSAYATVDVLDGGPNVSGAAIVSMDAYHDGNTEHDYYIDYLDTVRQPRSKLMSGYLESGALETDGSWAFRTTATALAQLVPVPEPSTYAMLLAGIGMLGWRIRRARVRPDGAVEDAMRHPAAHA